jgi:alkylhydroperoxidase/carboxymuconolactone decarboxylase family protein YurZ
LKTALHERGWKINIHQNECRAHLYGDVYSSPGLSLRRKQLLMCAALSEANMHEQLFGHALAVRPFFLISSYLFQTIYTMNTIKP